MSLVVKSLLVAVVAVLLSIGYYSFFTSPVVSTLQDKWWGKGPPTKESHEITKTQIEIPSEVIKQLYNRLHQTQPFQPSLDGVNQTYGIHTTVLNNVLDYWKNKYNWTERQEYLNQYPQYYVNIRGLRIHFLHIKPKSTVNKNGQQVKVLPLMMVHGWPGSFREFFDVIPRLTEVRNDRDFVFELVIPSLPGFTFSQYSVRPGLSSRYMAQIFADLMQILGFNQYYVQGGDWGSSVVQSMATFYPEKIIGIHSNMCFEQTLLSSFKLAIGKYFPSLIYEEDEEKLCHSTANSIPFLLEETGYFHIQSTKPDTVGVALRDSPMGLAAYMLEKFSTLTNTNYRYREDAGLTEKFTMNQLLDNIMLYWVTGCMTSAMRIYAEAFTNAAEELKRLPIQVPSGCARFPHEILLTPRSILKEKHKKLVHLTTFDRGGHFAALEEPELLSDDVFKFVETVENLKSYI